MGGIFQFGFYFPLIEVYVFVQQKAWTLNVIIPFKIKIIEKLNTILLPDLWFLSDKAFQNSSPKNSKIDLGIYFSKLKVWSFENVCFVDRNYFNKYLTFLYLLIYFFNKFHKHQLKELTQLIFTCSKSTIETKGMKYRVSPKNFT